MYEPALKSPYGEGRKLRPFRNRRWKGETHIKDQCFKRTGGRRDRELPQCLREPSAGRLEKREEIIGDCRAVMEALADCGSIDTEMEAVSSDMEVTAGLIQKLVDENATRKLDQHDYHKKV